MDSEAILILIAELRRLLLVAQARVVELEQENAELKAEGK